MPTFGSLFAGIGGIDLGLERAGWECRWQVEWDAYCQAVLARHWPDVPRYGDIRTLDTAALDRVDLVAGGFPCPPVSSAGLRRGRADPRWLWPDFARVIRDLRPRYVLVENVTGLLELDEFGDVLGDLAALGFDAEWSVVPACAVGAPHARERVFVVAYPQGNDESGQGSLPSASQRLRTKPRGSGGTPRIIATEWLPEPTVDRVADGLPAWMVGEPLGKLGNAVVPQVVEVIGRRLLEVMDVAA